MTGNIYLEMKLIKDLYSNLYDNNQCTKTFKNVSIRTSASHFNLITLNTSNPLNLFHGTIISILILGTKSLLIGLQSVLMAK